MSATTALLFPGQGSQTDGMRDRVAAACPELLELVIDLVGCDPFERVGESTAYAQPSIFLASVAAYEDLGRPEAAAFAGHSLGEIAALVAAGVLTAEDALRLVVVRGSVMAEAATREGGTMLAVLKGTLQQAADIAEAHGVTVANDNAPGQLVLAGPVHAIDAAAAAARESGLRAMRLDVAGAFHHRSMQSAMVRFRGALNKVSLSEPVAPVYSGLTAAPFWDVREELAQALVRPVRWRETLLALEGQGITEFVDVGPGRILAGLVKRTLAEASVLEAVDATA
jgi:malonyl CoA-acyl carrier protein transacylase